MPRYYFDLKDGYRLIDPSGVDCPNDEAAKKQAKVIAARIATDIPDRVHRRRVAVINDEGHEIVAVPVSK